VDVRAAFVAQREATKPRRERAHRALGIAARFAKAPTALSSGDDFMNGQKTPCLRTARTYAILTAPAAG
jgi:hypothetical protein